MYCKLRLGGKILKSTGEDLRYKAYKGNIKKQYHCSNVDREIRVK